MVDPIIASKTPSVLTLTPGVYYWCSCGKSTNQPFCDGSHKESTFQPVKFEVTTERRVALCNCKHSDKPVWCDGSHKAL